MDKSLDASKSMLAFSNFGTLGLKICSSSAVRFLVISTCAFPFFCGPLSESKSVMIITSSESESEKMGAWGRTFCKEKITALKHVSNSQVSLCVCNS
jgi:hypothetical protein